MNLWVRARQFWYTARHLKLRQIAGRLIEPIRRWRSNLPGPPSQLSGELHPAVSFPEHDPWNSRQAIEQGTFCFLNEARELDRPVDWHSEAPLLWAFNLHYFNYLHLLDKEEQAELCREWIEANPTGSDPGWHPYPTSLRIINWCKAGFEEQDILRSLYQQTAYLYRHLETHLLGNHLLENARALVFAGCFFGEHGEAPSWLERGLAVYREQTPEQILGDGGHFERSPMYHALMLEGYVDVLNLLPHPHQDRLWLADTVRSMSDFLVSMTHPNGQIALFNDATQEIAVPTQKLIRYIEKVVGYEPALNESFPEAGYYIHRDKDSYLVIDGGPVGPDYLPAHAHADVFSYELSVGGKPFIVDTGVYEYQAGSMRDYVRSTEAHNTVCVDGIDQAECWDSFRVARRYAPQKVVFKSVGARTVFKGDFNGYAQLIGHDIKHQRHIKVDGHERRITVEDVVTGQGYHTIQSRINLHPDVEASQSRGEIRLKRDDRQVRVSAKDSRVSLGKAWYCPEFGTRKERKVIIIEMDNSLPVHITYQIHY
jgi:uncharacterized heparinase superfamily protein